MGVRGLRLAAALLLAATPAAFASSGGIAGVSGNPSAAHGSSATCSGCHSGGAQTGTPSIAGSTSVSTNSTTAFTVQLSSSNATAAGFNLSIDSGTLAAGSGSYLIDYGAGGNNELTHSNKQFLSGSAASWGFSWTAPSTTGTRTMYVCINRVNNDSSSTVDSPTCTTKSVTVTNSAPSLNSSVNAAPAFSEGGGAVVLDSVLTLSDVDGDSLNRAEVEITANFQSGSDTLACPSCAGQGLSASFSSVTGQLTITGTATTTAYDTALQSVTFNNSSNAPTTSARTIAFRIRDTYNNTSADDTLSLSVTAVNDAPVISAPASIGVTEDVASALTGISFSDVDAVANIDAVFTVGSGSLNSPACTGVTATGTSSARTLTGSITNVNTCISGSNLTFTTAANVTATVTLGVAVDDNGSSGTGGTLSDTQNVSLTVTGVNDAPAISAPSSIGVTEDVATALTGISVSDVDAGSSNLTATFSVASGTLNSPSCASVTTGGTATARTLTGPATNINNCIGGMSLAFTTAANATANVALTVSLTDNGNTGSGGAQAATPAGVTLTVTAVNDAPTAVADPAGVSKNSSDNELDVLANDTDPDSGDTQSIFSVGTPNNGGSVVIGSPCAANRLCYTPATNFSGDETFTYIVEDGAGAQDSALVTVTVAQGASPVGVNDSLAVNEDASATVIDVLANDTDTDVGDTQEVTQVNASSSFPVTTVNGGSVALTAVGVDNALQYTPAANFNGSDSFTYTVRDAAGLTGSATVNVTITSINDAPTLTALASPLTVNEDATQQTVNLAGIGSGAANESQTLTVTATSSNLALVANPTVTYTSPNATGSIAFTPVANANGSATITVTVTDNGGTANGGVNSVQRQFTFGVTSVNDAPTLNPIANPAAVDEDAGLQTVNLSGIGSGAANESQTLTVTASSSNTAVIPHPAVSYASANATGSMSYTPVADANGSAVITVTVNDNGGTANGGVSSFQRTFTATVNSVNDTPVVDAIPDQSVTDNALFSYTVAVTDGDGETSFTYGLAGAPAGMAIDGNGTITWTPPVGTAGVFTPTVEATDGSSATGTRQFQVTVTAPDTDGDGMPDSFEDLHGLDKNDAADAAEDADGDGVSNLDEYLGDTDPTTDDIAPVVTAPADLVVPSTGYLTVVDLGAPTAVDGLDGALTATSDLASTALRPGRYTVTWTAVDAAGNPATDTQRVDVLPMADFNVGQVTGEGRTVAVTVTLNGTPPEYPVTIPYVLSGTADSTDSDAVDGAFTISSGLSATLPVVVASNADNAIETLIFTMTGADWATPGARTTHTLVISDLNEPPSVELVAFQNALPRFVAFKADGPVTVQATAVDPNGTPVVLFDWGGSDDALGVDAMTGSSISFDPSGLATGAYRVSLSIPHPTGFAIAGILISVVDGSSGDVDIDGDAILDSVDTIVDYGALLPDQTGALASSRMLEADPGLRMRRGGDSIRANRTGALISMDDLVARHGEFLSGGLPTRDTHDHAGGIFDFEIHGLAPSLFNNAGTSARIVLPLQVGARPGSVYRKFDANDGWQDFVVDDFNAVASAYSRSGQCPGPNSDEYVDGLQPFADCVRLTLEDGGPNDGDGSANSVIRDPGGVASPEAVGEPAPSVSSGAFLALWLPLAALLRLRRRLGAALLGLGAALVAAPAQAEHHVRIHYSGDLASGFDSNVTNAQQDDDIRESGFASATGNVDYLRNLSLYTTLLLRGSAQGEYWNSFDGLNNGKGTAMARLLYRGDGDFWTPTFAGWVSAAVLEFDSAIRDSNEYRAGAFVTENLTTQLTGRFALGASRRESDGLVYDLSGYSASVNLDWVPAPRTVVYTGYQYYVGDVASTASAASFWIVEAADAIEADDAFGGLAGGLLAYRLDARAQITTLGFNYAFSRKLSADVQGQYISTRATARIDYERMVGVVSLLARF
jgi:large repetitive protein